MCDSAKAWANAEVRSCTKEELIGKYLGVHLPEPSPKLPMATPGSSEADAMVVGRVHDEER